MRFCVAIGLLVVGCGNKEPQVSPAVGSAPAKTGELMDGCEMLPFATSTPVPEASGAAWMTIDGKLALVVISDSGNHGMYAIVDPDTGETREQGKLPLGPGTDDLEGAAVIGDTLFALTSPGFMHSWQRDGKGWKLVDSYPIGPVDPELKGNGNKAPKGDGMVCEAGKTNCGRNYEGLCLAPKPGATCAGFAASKADGHLYCLTLDAGKYVVHRDLAITITRDGAMADCAFGGDNTLYTGDNLFGMSQVFRVDGWDSPATAKVAQVAKIGAGFPETLAVRGDVIYRMSDTGGAPSLMAKFRCPPATR